MKQKRAGMQRSNRMRRLNEQQGGGSAGVKLLSAALKKPEVF